MTVIHTTQSVGDERSVCKETKQIHSAAEEH